MNVLGIHSSYVSDDHGFTDRGGVDGVPSAGASGDAGGSADCADLWTLLAIVPERGQVRN